MLEKEKKMESITLNYNIIYHATKKLMDSQKKKLMDSFYFLHTGWIVF